MNYRPILVQSITAARSTLERSLIVTNKSGSMQLWLSNLSDGKSTQITDQPGGTLFGSIAADGSTVYYLQDKLGDETGHLVSRSSWRQPAVDLTPQLPPYSTYTVATAAQGQRLAFTAVFKNKYCLYTLSLANNKPTAQPICLLKSRQVVSEPIISEDGHRVVVSMAGEALGSPTRLLVFDATTAAVITEFKVQGECLPQAFGSASNGNIILTLNKVADGYRPVKYDLKKQTATPINHPKWRGDVFVLDWSESTNSLIVGELWQARHKLYEYQFTTGQLKRIGPTTGSFDLYFGAVVWLTNGSLVTRWHDFNHVPQLIKISTVTGKFENYAKSPFKSKVHRESNFKLTTVSVSSSHRSKIQLWVSIPTATKKPYPFIIDLHGGPHDFIGDSYQEEALSWLAQGYGYCAVNYHGSISFGQKYAEAIYGRPGELEVDDTVAARQWLVKQGLAQPTAIFLHGWSWGGYVALLASGKHPDLWCGTVAGGAITDFKLQYQAEPASFKAIDRQLFGGTPSQLSNLYQTSSPIHYLDQIQSPILLIHGRNDARCPAKQIEHFAKTAKTLNKEVEVKWFASGHTGELTDNKLREDLLKSTLAFILKHTPK